MTRRRAYGVAAGAAVAAGILAAWLLAVTGGGVAPVMEMGHLLADGLERREIVLPAPGGEGGAGCRLEGTAGAARILQIRDDGKRRIVLLQAGVVPGRVRLVSGEAGNRRVVAELDVVPDWRDTDADGFPDSLELNAPGDKQAFRDWFRFLAEEQLYRSDGPAPEINDCAALLRYAYREALRRHDGEWATRVGLTAVRPMPDVARFQYPFTPLRADLFRLKPGKFTAEDLTSGAFGQFADAETLLLYNASAMGKDIGQARPGDLLFYRQRNPSMPFHAMIYLGPSTMEADGRGDYVLYHTGPDGDWKGEMRRPSLAELFRHPEPRWHPSPANPMFLGVYRWKILNQAGAN